MSAKIDEAVREILGGGAPDSFVKAGAASSAGGFAGGQAGARAVLIRVKDVAALVKAQGGGVGAFAVSLAPDTISDVVYSKIAAELASGFKEKGVDVDVKVVSPVGFQLAGSSPIWKPLAITFGAAGAGYGAWRIFKWWRGRK